jgi:hypothetical protein
VRSGLATTKADALVEAPLTPCRACGVVCRWATAKGNGRPVNMLLEAAPHPSGMYAVLSDGRRAVNLVWATEVDPDVNWLAWPGQRHRDHFTACGGWPGLRTPRDTARAAVETIGEAITPGERHRTQRSRRIARLPLRKG